MAISRIRSIKPKNGDQTPIPVKDLFGNLSLTNQYQVDFSSLSTFEASGDLLKYLKNNRKVDANFIRDAGLLCYEATLPGTSLATAEVKDNFMGISQEFAHTRLYTDFDFSFYVDDDYNAIRFFEGWIDFISSGSEKSDNANPSVSNYYRRMRYPDTYKCQSVTITKFEKNLKNSIKYSFINAFPKTISAIPVTYGAADILRVTVSFNYDRYLIDSDTISRGTRPIDDSDFTDLAATQPSAELQARRAQITRVEQPKQNPPAKSTSKSKIKITSDGREYTSTIDPIFGYEIRTFKN